jgi:hypothetical protein
MTQRHVMRGLLLVGVVVLFGRPAAQAPARVEFARDVQPIFRDKCYGCHGPDQQMNGFRLDRRADAMRGGRQTNIGPGNADGSRLYHRLIGTKFGTRMPPSAPLSDDEIVIIKSWIDQGAEWPDALAGATPTLPADPEAERLIAKMREGDRTAADQMLRSTPTVARMRGTGGSTPLMFAALYGDVGLMRQLLSAGADLNTTNAASATALMWAVPEVEKLRLLLDAGADVNAHSEENRTALVIAAGIVGARPAVRLLLEYGAVAWEPLAGNNPGPLREAARVDSPDVFRLLLEYGADPGTVPEVFLRTNCFECARLAGMAGTGPLAKAPPPESGLRPVFPESSPTTASMAVAVTAATPAAIREAVERSVPLLQRIDTPFIRKTGCVSCHHNTLVSMAVGEARRHGYRVDEAAVAEQRQTIATIRPPIESNDIEVTAVSMRALQTYAPKPLRQEYRHAIERARDWLATAKADATEERAFRVLGLAWAEADRALVEKASSEVLAAQRSDGGWAQQASMMSDAYATGEALVALEMSGVGLEHPGFRRGVEFLLRTQLLDGSWFVKSRSEPIQAYFESGFPHRADQWISAAATAWATTALAAATR